MKKRAKSKGGYGGWADFKVPKSGEGNITVLNGYLSAKARRITSRRQAIRSGNRAGLLSGMIHRGSGERLTRGWAKALALGEGVYVPERWRPLFVRSFFKAALFAAHTDHNVTASSKYGMS